MALGVAFALTFLHFNASALEIRLGTDNYDAALAGPTITGTKLTIINGGLGLTPDSAVISPIFIGLYDVDAASAFLARNDRTEELSWRTTPLRHLHLERQGSSVPDTGSTFLLLAFALATIFAINRPFSCIARQN